MKPPKSKRMSPGRGRTGVPEDDSLPFGKLATSLHDPVLHALVRSADVVLGVNPKTGKRSGLYYGIAALQRIVGSGIAEPLKVLKVPVDPATDDVEVLCVIVEHVKGAHCYGRPPD
jgi:hypothetical protein